jgi:muramoyltetrapeptide carboxypeptidase
LDLKSLRRHPKVFMGSSDVTVLLNWINAHTGMVTFHGPMVATNFSKGLRGIHFDSLKHALLRPGGSGRIVRWRISLRRKDVIRAGRASGKLVGGCLTLLVSTLGTKYEIETRDSILFLEDVNEAPYRVDRMLKQLEDAGKFEHVRGVVFGDMLNCVDSKNRGNNVRRVISSLSGRFRGPIVMGLSSGHTSHPIITLPIGARATLHLRGAPALIIEEATSR